MGVVANKVLRQLLLSKCLHGIAAESAEKILIADELPDLISQVIYKLQHNQII